jgi:hypothetical protein
VENALDGTSGCMTYLKKNIGAHEIIACFKS